MLRPGILGIGLALLCVSPRGLAQRLEFEAATVKPNKDGANGALTRTPGRLVAVNVPFSLLLEMAFETRQIDVSRISQSLYNQRFDITAKAAGRIASEQYWEMLRALLEDRFHLNYHRETREASFYALVLVRKGVLGPKLVRSADADCPVSPDLSHFCGVQGGFGSMAGQRVPASRIAREFIPMAGRAVADQTGLEGAFDFQLRWTPEEALNSEGQVKKLNGVQLDTSFPSFFLAIQEQLGLKLESRKGPIEFLVIDHAEEPEAN